MPIRYIKLFDDPTPDGYINQRYVMHMMNIGRDYTEFTDDEFNDFVKELLFIAKKLVATWKHMNKFIELEDSLIKAEQDKPPIENLDFQHLSYSQDLFLEMDEFLVQIKSTLDYLAKLPRAIVGKNNFPYLNTFGDKGGTVIKAIKNNLPKKWEKQGFIVREWLLVDQRPWLEIAIAARDKINHYKDGGLDYKAFLVAKITIDGEEKVIVPMWQDDFTVREYMKHTWYNLFTLTEQFTVGFLAMRFKSGIGYVHLIKPHESVNSPIIVAPDNAVEKIFEVESYLHQKSKNSNNTASEENSK